MGQLRKYFIFHIFFEFDESVVMLKSIIILTGLELRRVPKVLNLVILADLSVSPSINFKMCKQALQFFVIDIMSWSEYDIVGNEQSTPRCWLPILGEKSNSYNRLMKDRISKLLSLDLK